MFFEITMVTPGTSASRFFRELSLFCVYKFVTETYLKHMRFYDLAWF